MNFKRLASNWVPKSLSIALALVLWLVVILNQSRTAIFPGDIPIDYIKVGSNYSIVSDVNSVKIKVFAEPSVWKKLQARDFKASVTLNNYQEGTHRVGIGVDSAIENLQIVEVIPHEIMVTVEPRVSKEVEIEVKTLGDPKEEFSIASISVDPQKALLTGAKSLVEKYSSVIAKLNINGEFEQKEARVAIELANSRDLPAQSIQIGPSEAIVKVEFTKTTNTKAIPVNLVMRNELSPEYIMKSIQVIPSVVNVSGESQDISRLDKIDTSPLDLASVNKSDEPLISLIVPPNIKILDNTTQVKVKIEVAPILISKSYLVPILLSNIPQHLKIDRISAGNSLVVAEGSIENQLNLNPDNLKFRLNLNKIKSGNNTLELNQSSLSGLSSGLNIKNISPDKIEITASSP